MSDNRTNEPSEQQVEWAARAFFREYHGEDIWPEIWDDGELDTRSRALAATRAALAAAGVASQPVVDEAALAEVIADAPHSGDPNVSCLDPRCKAAAVAAWLREGVAPQEPKCEHGIALIDLCQFADQVANDESDPQEPSRLPDFFAPKPMPISYVPAPVLPSSGIDEDALAEVERAAAARALEEAADDIESRRNEPGLVHLDVRYAGYYTGIRSGMESDSKALRVRAAEIREGKLS